MAVAAGEVKYSTIGGLENDLWAKVFEIGTEYRSLDQPRLSALRSVVRLWVEATPDDVICGQAREVDGQMVGIDLVLDEDFLDYVRTAARRLDRMCAHNGAEGYLASLCDFDDLRATN